MKAPTENLEQAAVQQQCRSLRLPAVAEQCASLADVATKQRQTYLRYLEALLTAFHQAVAAHTKFLKTEAADAEAAVLDFLGLTEPPEDFGQRVRIVLVSPDFSRELTTAVLWLNNNGLDIQVGRRTNYP